MSTEAKTRVGLHLRCFWLRPNHWLFHMRGILRELHHPSP